MTIAELLVALKLDTAKFDEGLDGAKTSFGGFMDGLGKAGGLLGGALVTGIAAVGAAAFKAGVDYDTAMDTIRLGTGATGEALAALGKDFDAVFTKVPSDAKEVSTAIADLNTRLDLSGEPLQAMATQFLHLAEVLDTQVGPLIELGAQTFNNWQIATQDQAAALDYLWKVSQSTGIGIDALMSKVTQFGPALRQMGFDFETSAAMIGQLEKSGLSAESVLGSFNIALRKMAEEGITDSKGALESLITQIKNAGTSGEANKISIEAFGRSGVAMASAIREGKLELGNFVAGLKSSSETINQAAEDTFDFGEQLTIFKNKATSALAPVGAMIFDTLNSLVAVIGPVVQQLVTELSPAVTSIVSVFGQLVAAIVPVVAQLLTAFMPAVQAILGAVQTVIPIIVAAFQSLLPPVLELLTTAIIPLATNLIQLLGPAFQVIGNLLTLLMPLLGGLLQAVVPLATFIGTVLNVVLESFHGFLSSVATAIGWVAEKLGLLPGVTAGVKESADKVTAGLVGMNTAADGTAASILKAEGASKGFGTEQSKLNQGLKETGSTLGQTNISLGKHKSSVDAVAEAYSKLGLKNYKKEADELRKSVDALKKSGDWNKLSVDDQREALDKLERAEYKARGETSDLNAEVYRFMQRTKDARLESSAWQLALESIDTALAGVNGEVQKLKLPEFAQDMSDLAWETAEAAGKVAVLKDAYSTLGLKSKAELEDIVTKTEAAKNAILGDQTASDFAKKTAIYKALEAQRDLAIANGTDLPEEQRKLMERLKQETDTGLTGQGGLKGKWEEFSTAIGNIIGGFATSMAEKLWDGETSWGEKFKGMLQDLGEAVTAVFITPATQAISLFVSDVLEKLLQGKFSEIWDSFEKLGGKLKDIFTGGGGGGGTPIPTIPTVPGIPTTPTTPPTVPSPGGGGGGGGGKTGGGGAPTGWMGAVDVVSGIATAVSSIIGNFQMMGMNKSLDIIVKHTLQSVMIAEASFYWFTQFYGEIRNGILDSKDRLDWINTNIAEGFDQVHQRLIELRTFGIAVFSSPGAEPIPVTLADGMAPEPTATAASAPSAMDLRPAEPASDGVASGFVELLRSLGARLEALWREGVAVYPAGGAKPMPVFLEAVAGRVPVEGLAAGAPVAPAALATAELGDAATGLLDALVRIGQGVLSRLDPLAGGLAEMAKRLDPLGALELLARKALDLLDGVRRTLEQRPTGAAPVANTASAEPLLGQLGALERLARKALDLLEAIPVALERVLAVRVPTIGAEAFRPMLDRLASLEALANKMLGLLDAIRAGTERLLAMRAPVVDADTFRPLLDRLGVFEDIGRKALDLLEAMRRTLAERPAGPAPAPDTALTQPLLERLGVLERLAREAADLLSALREIELGLYGIAQGAVLRLDAMLEAVRAAGEQMRMLAGLADAVRESTELDRRFYDELTRLLPGNQSADEDERPWRLVYDRLGAFLDWAPMVREIGARLGAIQDLFMQGLAYGRAWVDSAESLRSIHGRVLEFAHGGMGIYPMSNVAPIPVTIVGGGTAAGIHIETVNIYPATGTPEDIGDSLVTWLEQHGVTT